MIFLLLPKIFCLECKNEGGLEMNLEEQQLSKMLMMLGADNVIFRRFPFPSPEEQEN
jgi:hypothetical protein